jgi:hypothetical protein
MAGMGDHLVGPMNSASRQPENFVPPASEPRKADQGRADRPEALADFDQTRSDSDQAAADRDQTAADNDQAAADSDQAASDRALVQGGDPACTTSRVIFAVGARSNARRAPRRA